MRLVIWDIWRENGGIKLSQTDGVLKFDKPDFTVTLHENKLIIELKDNIKNKIYEALDTY